MFVDFWQRQSFWSGGSAQTEPQMVNMSRAELPAAGTRVSAQSDDGVSRLENSAVWLLLLVRAYLCVLRITPKRPVP